MYVEGDEYERGLIYGVLAKELIEKQEACFVKQINELIPNKRYQNILKLLIAWFNKDICKYIPVENQKEIYGISLSFADKFNYLGPSYYRILNYHAAHDIGHALNDYSMVGCTSFATTKEYSSDSNLLVARNFDFYLGDEFAKEKLLVFVNPKTGYKFASYGWAGFTGIVSGMNEKGLTVTINASKSDVPFASKEPISILAREILQYSKNIDDAVKIAKKRETFVSESILIGSAEDNKAVIIEKSPHNTEVYKSPTHKLICTNHYQSVFFMRDSINLNNIDNSDSKYRFDRINELLRKNSAISVTDAVEILRNKEGMNNKNIGLGNPKSINQLISHHSIIFKPKDLKMWVSTSPYQLGEYVCYDIGLLFNRGVEYHIDSLNIKEDFFVHSEEYKNYVSSNIIIQKIKNFTLFDVHYTLDSLSEITLIKANQKSYLTYMIIGDYYKKAGNYLKAKKYYIHSSELDVSSKNKMESIENRISACEKLLSQ